MYRKIGYGPERESESGRERQRLDFIVTQNRIGSQPITFTRRTYRHSHSWCACVFRLSTQLVARWKTIDCMFDRQDRIELLTMRTASDRCTSLFLKFFLFYPCVPLCTYVLRSVFGLRKIWIFVNKKKRINQIVWAPFIRSVGIERDKSMENIILLLAMMKHSRRCCRAN